MVGGGVVSWGCSGAMMPTRGATCAMRQMPGSKVAGMGIFDPERYFSRVSNVHVQHDLLDVGFVNVLLDMDNTVVSRATHDVPRDVRLWLSQAREAGVNICLLSNNWHQSPYKWSVELDIPVVAKACKPLPHAFLIARDKLRARSADTVVIGDQLITDVVGAHLLGMQAYLVCPLAEVDLKHTVLIRNFERMLLRESTPEGALVAKK